MQDVGKRKFPTDVSRIASDMVGGSLAEFVDHVLGVGPVANTLAPALGGAVRALREADRRMWEQVARAITVASDEVAGGGMAPIDDLVLADAARTELFRRVVQASARTTLDEKIPALGRVLAQGVGNAGKLDEALILAAALADLDGAHVLVLSTIADPTPHLDELGQEQTQWGVHELADHLEPYKYLMISLISTLERHALIADIGERVTGGRLYAVTEIGGSCLTLLDGAPSLDVGVSR